MRSRNGAIETRDVWTVSGRKDDGGKPRPALMAAPRRHLSMLRSYTAADALKEMDEGGVTAAVIHPPGWDPNSNALAVEAARQHPNRFAILEAWRDGYAEPIGELTPVTRESALAYFEQMIANIRDPRGYAVWMVPVVSARVPAGTPRA